MGYTLAEYRASSGSPPSLPIWQTFETGSPPPPSVSGSILFQGPVGIPDTQRWSAGVPLDFTHGTYWIEWKMRIIASGSFLNDSAWRTGWRMRCVSNLRQEYVVGLTTNAAILGDNWDSGSYTGLNFTSEQVDTTVWRTYRLDLTPGMATLSVDGQGILTMVAGPSVHPSQSDSLDFGDGSSLAGSQSELEYLAAGTYGVRIQVGLNDWIPPVAGQSVDVELLDESGVVLLGRSLTVQNDGTVFMPSYPDIRVRARVKASHWLSQTIPDLVDPGGEAELQCSLINGDCDGDNAITVFDYNVLSDAFDSAPGDPNWAAGADLDGDESVTVYDYNILSQGFDLVGD